MASPSLQHKFHTLERRTDVLEGRIGNFEDSLCPACKAWTPSFMTAQELKSIRLKRTARFRELMTQWEQAKAQGMTHKIWRTVGGAGVRASHMAANNQKVKIDETFKIGNDHLFLPADPTASFGETANCRCGVNYVKEGGNGTVTAPRPIPKPTPPERPRYRRKDSTVILNEFVQARLRALARAFYEKTGKELIVTDGFRTPKIQATRMYDRASKNTLTSVYGQFNAAKEIQDAYNLAAKNGASRTEKIVEMSKVIADQISRGIYISDHLRNNAIDVSSKVMSSNEKAIFRDVAQNFASKVLFEYPQENKEHWHLEF